MLEFNFCQILCWFLVELLPSLGEPLIPPLHKLSVIMVVDFMGKIPDPLQLFIVIHCVFCRAQPLFCQFYAQCKCQDSFKLHINLHAATLRIIFFLFLCLFSSQYYIIEIAFSFNFSLQLQLMILVSDDGSCKAEGNGSQSVTESTEDQ